MRMITELENIRKKKTIFYFSIIGAIYLLILGAVNMHLAKYLICAFDFSIAGLLFLNLFIFARRNKLECASTIVLTVLLAFYDYLFIEGGIKNTGILWLFTYPMAAFFFKGKRNGLIWVLAFFMSLIMFYVISKTGLIVLTHGEYFLVIFFFAFLLITAFVYSYENIRTESEDIILSRNCELNEINMELDYLSNRDSLTGIYNRRYVIKSLEDEISRFFRYEDIFSVLLIDIDNFKNINDTRGHQTGDMIIKKVAKMVLDYHLRDVDVFARYGGDEFLIILPNTDKEGARIVGEKLCNTIRKEVFVDETTQERIPVSLSIGISTIDKGKDQNSLLFEADLALYKSKKDGKDMATVFSPKLTTVEEFVIVNQVLR